MKDADLPNWFEFVKPNFSCLPKDIELRVLQIGVYKGDCTQYLLDNYKVSQIVDVDPWEGSMGYPEPIISFNALEKIYDERFVGDDRIKKMKMTSDMYFANSLLDERFDFIYIDGDHKSSQVLLDAINGFARLKVGGILSFDDYEWERYSGTFKNPKFGIDSWLKLFDGHFELLIKNYQIWVEKIKDFD
jgi:predicted O-methyltransferase YrrM